MNKDLKGNEEQKKLSIFSPKGNQKVKIPQTTKAISKTKVDWHEKGIKLDGQIIDARQVQEKTGILAQQYLKSTQKIDTDIAKIISQQKVAHMKAITKNTKLQEEERLRKEALKSSPDAIDSLQIDVEETKADKFVRSNANVFLRVRDQVDDEIEALKVQKSELQQKVNDALIKLKNLNEKKLGLLNKLSEASKFVRDLQKAQAGDLDSISSIEIQKQINQEKEVQVQLKLQIQKASTERSDLIEKLKQIQVPQMKLGEMNLKGTKINPESQLQGIISLKHKLGHQDHEINSMRAIVMKSEDILQHQQIEFTNLGKQKQEIIEKTIATEHRLEHDKLKFEHQKKDMQHLHQLHLKLFAVRILEESLQKTFRNNNQLIFEDIKDKSEYNFRLIEAASKFKNLFYSSQKRQLERFVKRWQYLSYDPTKQQLLTQKTGLYFITKITLCSYYRKWRKLFLMRQQFSIKKKLYVEQFFNRASKAWMRRICSYFYFWKTQIATQNKSLNALLSYSVRYTNYRYYLAFKKWIFFCRNQTLEARTCALGINLTKKQILLKIFSELYSNKIQKKVKNWSILVRAFKNLKAKNDMKNFLNKFDTLATIYRKEVDLKNALASFNMCKRYMMHRKLRKQLKFLAGDMDVSIRKWADYITEFTRLMRLKQFKRVFLRYQVLPIRQILMQRMNKWRQKIIFKQVMMKYLGICFLKSQRLTLDTIWVKWVQNTHHKIIKFNKTQLAIVNKTIKQTKIQIYNAKESIDDTHKQNFAMAKKSLRRVTEQLFVKYMHRKLIKWQQGAIFKRSSINSIMRIAYIKRFGALRIYFMNFKRCSQQILLDRFAMRRGTEFINRLNNRLKFKVYNKIHTYTSLLQIRKKGLRTLFNQFNKNNIENKLKQWKQATFEIILGQKLQNQNNLVTNMQNLQQQLGSKIDAHYLFEQKIKKLFSVSKTQAKVCFYKWFQRFYFLQIKQNFRIWTQKTKYLSKVAIALRLFKSHSQHTIKFRFFSWKLYMQQEKIVSINERIGKKVVEVQSIKYKFVVDNRQHEQSKQKINNSIQKMKENVLFITKRNDKLALSMQKKNYVYQYKLRYLFKFMKNFCHKQQQATKHIEKSLFKVLAAKFILKLGKINKLKIQNYKNNKVALCCIKMYDRFTLRHWVSRWKINQKLAVKYERNQILQYTQKIVHTHQLKIQKMQNYHVIQFQEKYISKSIKFKCFQAIASYKHNQNFKQDQIAKLISVFEGLKIRFALKKMNQRTKLTRKMRQFSKKHHAHKIFHLLFISFQEIRNQHILRRKCGYWLSCIQNILLNGVKQSGFNAVKYYSQIATEGRLRNIEYGAINFVKKIDNFIFQRFINGFNKIKLHIWNHASLTTAIKTLIFVKRSVWLRNRFTKWKYQTKKISVVAYNENELGPINIEAWKYRQYCRNLITMIKCDTQEENSHQDIVQYQITQNKQTMKKVIIRFMLQQDPDMKILPIYFERLKMHMKVRQYWRYNLNVMEKRLDNSQIKFYQIKFFQKWRENARKIHEFALKTTLQKLQKRNLENKLKLNDIQADIEYKKELFEEFSEQNDVLREGVIKAKSLAIANSQAIYKRAQHKTIAELQNYSNKQLNQQISVTLQDHIIMINKLKEKVFQLELNNQTIAQGNDQAREEAMLVIRNAKEIEQLQSDIDDIEVEKRQQRIFADRLLESNKNYKIKLDQIKLNPSFDQRENLQTNGPIINNSYQKYTPIRQPFVLKPFIKK